MSGVDFPVSQMHHPFIFNVGEHDDVEVDVVSCAAMTILEKCSLVWKCRNTQEKSKDRIAKNHEAGGT